jgi:tryptophanyl-tRNA synthetase
MGHELAGLEIPDDLEPLFPARVATGAQPCGHGMHLGHYFGIVRPVARLQFEYPGDAFVVLADYHALAAQDHPERLSETVRAFALDCLALGLDPSTSTLYRQSDVPQVCELMWILGCTARKARLDHAHRAATDEGRAVSLGRFLSPALLAADFLALRATDVPLGGDQQASLELVREIGRAFNRRWRAVFPLPHLRRPIVPSVPGLDGRTMSAAHGKELPVFWADEDELECRVMRMVTGSARLGDPIDPDSCTVFALYSLVADPAKTAEMRDGLARGRLGYRDSKRMLLGALRSHFARYHERRRKLQADEAIVDDVLHAGARRVREEAEATLDAVRECIGLSSSRRHFI